MNFEKCAAFGVGRLQIDLLFASLPSLSYLQPRSFKIEQTRQSFPKKQINFKQQGHAANPSRHHTSCLTLN